MTVMPQELMESALQNYFTLSDVLCSDLRALLDSESSSQHWRRNFIRVSASLIEGYAHSLRQMCAVSFHCIATEIARREAQVIRDEKGSEAAERIKLTLRAAYKLFQLPHPPDFGGQEWSRAQRALEKRNSLMHPKSPADLELSDPLWSELHAGITWIIEQLFDFVQALQKAYT